MYRALLITLTTSATAWHRRDTVRDSELHLQRDRQYRNAAVVERKRRLGYDELNRLQTVKDNRLVGNQNKTYAYDAVGNLQSYTYPNQVTTSYAYNNLNRLTTMTVSNGPATHSSYSYTLGAAGNRTQVVELGGRTVNYVYDDLYRLASETTANSANNGVIATNMIVSAIVWKETQPSHRRRIKPPLMTPTIGWIPILTTTAETQKLQMAEPITTISKIS